MKFGYKVSCHVQWHLWIQVNHYHRLGQPRGHLDAQSKDASVDKNGERIRFSPGGAASADLKNNFFVTIIPLLDNKKNRAFLQYKRKFHCKHCFREIQT